MQQNRPTSVLVIAILNIVFGGIGLLGGLCGLASQAMTSSMPRPTGNAAVPDLQRELEKQVPGYVAITLVFTGTSLLMSGALLGSGIGLLQMRDWARRLCFGYAGYLVIRTVVEVTFNILFVLPAMQRWQEAFARQFGGGRGAPPMAFFSIGLMGGVIFGALAGITYAAVLVFIMTRPHVKAAFAGEPPPPTDYDDRGFIA